MWSLLADGSGADRTFGVGPLRADSGPTVVAGRALTIDVKHPLRIAAFDASIGRRATVGRVARMGRTAGVQGPPGKALRPPERTTVVPFQELDPPY